MPPRFSMVRVLLPVVTVVGIGLIILAVILILNNRANIGSLSSDVTEAETSVTQQQGQITTLNAQISPVEATAKELDARITAMERRRATFHEDLDQIERLATGQVSLKGVNHGGSSVAVTGSASGEDDIFNYARALEDGGRFSQVWISSITGSGSSFSFSFSLTK